MKKLALVAFEKGEGPWIRARGDEYAAVVKPLADGEVLLLEKQNNSIFALPMGETLIRLERHQMYRFVKTVPEGQKPTKTSVEIMINV